MATGTLFYSPWFTALDNDGVTLPGALCYFYLAGTTTPVDTFTDVTLLVPNTNPMVCDAGGRAVIFLTPGVSYLMILKDQFGTTVKTVDNISAVPAASGNLDITGIAGEAIAVGEAVYLSDGSGSLVAGRWYRGDADNTYSSSAATSVGMAPSAIASGASGVIRVDGRVTGLAGLTAGVTYFISGTVGALTAVAPTFVRVMGVADSSTSLVLVPDPSLQNLENVTLTGGISVGDGTVTAPSITFRSDTNTGLYRVGADTLAVTTGGVQALLVDSTQFIDSPTQPRCSARKTTTDTTTNESAAIVFDAESYDIGGWHAPSSTDLIVPTGGDGFYLLVANTRMASPGANAERVMRLKKNGTTIFAASLGATSGLPFGTLRITDISNAVAADVFTLTLDGGGQSTTFGDATDSWNMTRLAVVKLW